MPTVVSKPLNIPSGCRSSPCGCWTPCYCTRRDGCRCRVFFNAECRGDHEGKHYCSCSTHGNFYYGGQPCLSEGPHACKCGITSIEDCLALDHVPSTGALRLAKKRCVDTACDARLAARFAKKAVSDIQRVTVEADACRTAVAHLPATHFRRTAVEAVARPRLRNAIDDVRRAAAAAARAAARAGEAARVARAILLARTTSP